MGTPTYREQAQKWIEELNNGFGGYEPDNVIIYLRDACKKGKLSLETDFGITEEKLEELRVDAYKRIARRWRDCLISAINHINYTMVLAKIMEALNKAGLSPEDIGLTKEKLAELKSKAQIK